jgi:ATP adenylyltransferase
LRQLATALLMEDESQLLYYGDRIKKMPLPVVRRHGIITSDRNVVSLNAGKLSYQERAAIELARTQQLAGFLQRRGLATWEYRLIDTDPVRADIRYQMLAAANGRCALCGAHSSERRIEVDHIVPAHGAALAQ